MRIPLKEYYQQLLYVLHTYPQAGAFIIRHRLWSGFWQYNWVSKLLLLAAVLVGLQFISSVTDWFRSFQADDPLMAMSAAGGIFMKVIRDEYQYLSSGSIRYLMMILLEVVIFHVCRQTISVLTGCDSKASMKAFLKAQMRMIRVVIYCYVLEMLLGLGLKSFFNFFGFLDFIEPALLLLISIFFLGFAVMDNYLEQFGLSVKESLTYSQPLIGIALGVGLVIQVLFMVPILGPVVAPMLAAETPSIALYELTDLHLSAPKTAINQAD